MTYCFDASACLRFLDSEEGSDRVEDIVRSCAYGHSKLVISAIQWGEIAAIMMRRGAAQSVSQTLSTLLKLGFEAAPVSPQQAVSAAVIQIELKIHYADAFLVALVKERNPAVLVTADYDFKAAEHLVSIEFLPVKPMLPNQP